jgi:hypothetical protein
MKRPKQQIIDAAGERQMRSIFEPLGWAVRKFEKDNGIDFDIEVFDNFKSAGIFFKVQLKSSEGTRYSASKEFISLYSSNKGSNDEVCSKGRGSGFCACND